MRIAFTPGRGTHHAPDTLARPSHWTEGAVCSTAVDPDLWWAEGGSPDAVADVEAAKQICRRCPSQPSCLTYALEHGERDGVWGGLDPQERKVLVPYRPASRKAAPTPEASDGPPQEHAATA